MGHRQITFVRALRCSGVSACALMLSEFVAPITSIVYADDVALSATKKTSEATIVARANNARDSWWAYRALTKPTAPTVRDESWCRNDIDRFILARIEAKNLQPAVEASREVLIRRASLDLTGLPPTPEEVAAFVVDESSLAYETLIDRLLASEHYGEKWARHWLDLVRYADTNGFERDSEKTSAWKYRDFVVRSFNEDLPYAEFIREQLAGDEIRGRDFDSIVATGFYRLGLWDDEVPDLAQALADDMDGIVDTTARTFLGISLGCARCHDHKGDPIRQKEYYQFAAWFAGVAPYKESAFNSLEADNVLRMVRSDFGHVDPEVELAAYVATRASLIKDIRAIEVQAGLCDATGFPDRASNDALVAHLRFEDDRGNSAANAVNDAPAATVRDAGFAVEGRIGRAFHFDGGDDRVEIKRTIGDDFTISFFMRTTDVGGGSESDRRWFRGDGLVDGEIGGITRDFGISLIANGYIAAGAGAPETFLTSGPGYNDGQWHHVALTRVRSSGELELFVDGMMVDHARGSTERLDAPKSLAIGAMLHADGPFSGDIDEVRLYTRALPATEVRSMALGIHSVEFARSEVTRVLGESSAQTLMQTHASLDALRLPELEGETVLAVREKSAPSATHIMQRGSPHALGEEVQPDVPLIAARFAPDLAVAPAHGESSGRRLALANWIADARNGLTWRTISNRLWQHHFNEAVVPTPNDFGRLGEEPTHPELVDWLAATLIENGGSLKAMHRVMMTSASYRMSSVATEQALSLDAPNELLTRFRMRRLTAEELRDSMLAANGTLNNAMGGPAVRPPLPREVLETSSRPNEVWPLTEESSWTRRSLYVMLKRSLQMPLLSAFDLADLDSPCPVRFATVVPTQALSMINGDLTNREAALLARRVEREFPGQLRQQIVRARQLTSGRTPSGDEVDEAIAFVQELQNTEKLSPEQALDSLCLVCFNLNEFLYID